LITTAPFDADHRRSSVLLSGANQAIQDAYSLAHRIVDFNTRIEKSQGSETIERPEPPSLNQMLGEYQTARLFPTASITVKAAIIGFLETGGRNGFFAKFRDTFFRMLHFIGVPRQVLLDSSIPKI
jgi:hypothetical protein